MRHLDEAREAAISALSRFVAADERVRRAVLIDDLFGTLRVVVWTPPEVSASVRQAIDDLLRDEANAGQYWTGEVWLDAEGGPADRLLYESAWNAAQAVAGVEKLRVADRHRNRGAWFASVVDPPWPPPVSSEVDGPPIVVFYSFKGGVGRSTSVAAFAIQRARLGERVAVVDFDLDAPGVGALLAADTTGAVASWGVLDYLLERPRGEVELGDYYHACRRQEVTGAGEILVFPTGRLDTAYLQKLARIDLEPSADRPESHPILLLLDQIRRELQPKWILLDARTGFSEAAGFLLSGLGHLHVLFGTSSEQSWGGLRIVVSRLGEFRVRSGHAQAECVVVQSLVPRESAIASVATAVFEGRAQDEFVKHYYAEDPADPAEEELWYVRDAEGEDAPHVSMPLLYDSRLAHFRFVDDVANDLAESPDYVRLGERISDRFFQESTE